MLSALRPIHFTAALAVGGFVLPTARVQACGPDFPNAYLVTAGEELARLPTLSFAGELARLLPPGTVKPQLLPHHEDAFAGETLAAEASAEHREVRTALAAAGVSGDRLEALVARYDRQQPPAELPAEFHLYAEGARAWHAGQPEAAIRAWRRLLALPPDERRHRTTWATYMIGRALGERDPRAARRAFQAVRDTAGKGFADSEGLATASWGWEARSHLHQQHYADALRLYFQQFAAGDPTAVPSLQKTLRLAFREPDDLDPLEENNVDAISNRGLKKLAADPQLRGIVNAWFVSRGGPHAPWSARAVATFNRWLSALPRDRTLTPAEAERWAWAAYQNGRWSEAADFAALAPENSAAKAWVRAMLQLRDGDVAGAAEYLARAARAFPRDAALDAGWFGADQFRYAATGEDLPDSRLGGVRGVLALQREQYLEALRLFLFAGHWADAAYVAECVLSLTELREFVTAEVPAPATGPDPEPSLEVRMHRDLRALLARRLVRAGNFAAAREFFPADFVAGFDAYVADLRQGYRRDASPDARAAALWRAAQFAKQYGMELQGTELAPDFTLWGGNFEWPQIGHFRRTGGDGGSWQASEEREPLARLAFAPDAEVQRVADRNLPTRRFHYRQRAAELAFLAATLLPDDDEQTARILNTAGRWIAARDPEEAQLFYKTLVFRCPNTLIGRAAAERRWFVPEDAAGVNR